MALSKFRQCESTSMYIPQPIARGQNPSHLPPLPPLFTRNTSQQATDRGLKSNNNNSFLLLTDPESPLLKLIPYKPNYYENLPKSKITAYIKFVDTNSQLILLNMIT